MQTATRPSSIDRRYIAVHPFGLFAAWNAAWLVNLALRPRIGWGVETDTLYWIALKAILWVLPAVLIVHRVERVPVARFLGLCDAGAGLRWGAAVSASLVAINYFAKALPSGTPLHKPSFDLVFANAVIVAPLVEEITLRGFLLTSLELDGASFWRANILTTIVFAAMHLPGWYFQGRATTFGGFAQRLVPIALLSVLFGWTKKRSGSLYAAIIVHAINNLYSTLLP